MKHQVFAALGCLIMAPQMASANFADIVCDDTTRVKERLATVVGAEPQGQGLRGPDALLEIWIVPGSGDWTMLQSYANGTSCIVAMGENWEQLASPGPA